MPKPQRPPDPETLIEAVDRVNDRFDGGASLPPERRAELVRACLIESVASAGRLDGSPRGDDRVTLQLSHPEQAGLVTPDEQLAAGLLAALSQVHQAARVLRPGTSALEQLHGLLTQHATGDQPVWRTRPVCLVTLGPGGARASQALAADVPDRLAELFTHLNDAASSAPPLLRVAHAAFGYLELQPFEAVSMRLFGTFVTWLLLRAGYDHARFVSFDRLLEAHREACGEALAEAQQASWSHHPTLVAWERWFLGLLVTQARQAEQVMRG